MVAYNPDTNAILTALLKNRKGSTIKNAWEEINNKLKLEGVKTNIWILDNDCSEDLKNTLAEEDITWKLIPLHQC